MDHDPLDRFLELARRRRATRRFRPDPLPPGVLEKLLEAARWAPSGYNLQPTHFVVVTEAARRRALVDACMGQRQVAEAPAVVVFAGDRRVAQRHFEAVLADDKAVRAIDEPYERVLRRTVPLAFGTGPVGVGWLWKASLPPLLAPFTPIPSIPAVHRRYWLAKQAALCAMNLMLAATAAGLATCPMEGFDERRVRRTLGLPRRVIPILVVPVGYAASDDATKSRLSPERLVHWQRW